MTQLQWQLRGTAVQSSIYSEGKLTREEIKRDVLGIVQSEYK
jgi:hypothetical protein